MRIGQGYDVHAFTSGDHVMLGGERIAHTHGVLAHSDGDVLLHAVCDALLGAAALGDIGVHFPDRDSRWRGADSRTLLRHVMELVSERGLRVVNLDATVLADAPRLGGHREAMRANIAADLRVEVGCVNVKATTSEGLGFIGRREGLACMAVVLLEAAA
ncbi:MAG TPA: 2-C-methyl-D-erythritol 2,4-cyclodiphosphate synthase [Steroidobacter sp.]|nr:2-C-methyl-D-erythritol 2,4-cyclodiphosphate synthase [Steroidobacteraceae bacterium]HLS81422.1 2-C-methyl-D-erythritol 2,4-cyclodiphosphate synthase [Steroidobacter sp.]